MYPLLSLGIDYLCQSGEQVASRIRSLTKNKIELALWKIEMKRYLKWYKGRFSLHGVPPPPDNQKVTIGKNATQNACMTWNRIYQQPKYLSDLGLDEDAFSGQVLLDIGAGPHPNALCFKNCEIYGIDHLMNRYSEIGFPTTGYEKRYHFVQGKAESMPFKDEYFDAAIAVNALDHIDNLSIASREMKRVLKRNGFVRFIVEYHKSTVTEPLELNDDAIIERFSWVSGLKKISESSADWKWPAKDRVAAANSPRNHEDSGSSSSRFAVWSNF